MFLRVDDEFVSVRLSLCPKTLKPHFSVDFQWNFILFISNDARQHVLQYNTVIFLEFEKYRNLRLKIQA